MGEQVVPWAEGRRALVYERATGQWVSAVGMGPDEELPDGERPGWESWFRETDEEPGVDRGRGWECLWHHETRTRLLPNQCPRCYEVGGHADGCMVLENLARGVPAFWAPWVMWTHPSAEGCLGLVLVLNMVTGALVHVTFVGVEPGASSSAPLVALGPDGPTLAPWGLP